MIIAYISAKNVNLAAVYNYHLVLTALMKINRLIRFIDASNKL